MQRLGDLWHSGEWRFPLALFLLLRFGLWGWMLLVHRLIPLSSAAVNSHPYLGIPPEQNALLEVWQRWDTLHYQLIAAHGYRATSLEPFAPLYPLLMRLSAFSLGNNTLSSGLLVSSIFCLAAFLAFLDLAKMELGTRRSAQQALVYLALFPTAFFLFAPYSESVFLLGAIMCIRSLRKKKWVESGLWGILAVCARLPGALLVLPAIYEAWQGWRASQRFMPWIAPLIILIGIGLFPAYLWLVLRLPPWAILQTQDSAYHRSLNFPGFNLGYAIKDIFNGIFPLVNGPDLIFALLFIAGTILVWKKLPVLYGIYTTSFMLLYLSTSTFPYALYSMSRFVLILFPVFMIMPLFIKNKKVRLSVLMVSFAGLLFYSAQFAVWGWAG
ncbi:MAG TPA: mannosyltransferase family protein [Anaerolineales bacterium]|nr:mannosyltransferase family protein [Anaerolineales bacterium]